MFDQFQALYSTGSLISELLQIHQGKFVVRVEAQVDGVTRATGLAAAENLELAEDRARSRALMVLGIEPSASAQTEMKTFLPPALADVDRTNALAIATKWDDSVDSSFPPVSPREKPTLAPAESHGIKGNHNGLPVTPTQIVGATATTFDMTPSFQEEGSGGKAPIGNEWLVEESDNHSHEESRPVPAQTQPETLVEAKQSIDATEAIAHTSAELKRLGWSNQQGRDYLRKVYGKTSRKHLTDDEMIEFLKYLEAEPSPNQLPLL